MNEMFPDSDKLFNILRSNIQIDSRQGIRFIQYQGKNYVLIGARNPFDFGYSPPEYFWDEGGCPSALIVSQTGNLILRIKR